MGLMADTQTINHSNVDKLKLEDDFIENIFKSNVQSMLNELTQNLQPTLNNIE